MDAKKIGERLHNLRLQKGKKISEVAFACGVSVSAVSQYENGVRIPRDSIKAALARYYGLSVDDLFFAA